MKPLGRVNWYVHSVKVGDEDALMLPGVNRVLGESRFLIFNLDYPLGRTKLIEQGTDTEWATLDLSKGFDAMEPKLSFPIIRKSIWQLFKGFFKLEKGLSQKK